MNRVVSLRNLRIAMSVLCALLCLALVMLRARSYLNRDIITWGSKTGPGFYGESVNGSIALAFLQYGHGYVAPGWDTWTQPPNGTVISKFETNEFFGFHFKAFGVAIIVAAAPLWSFVVLTAVLTVVPWLRLTYSLRDLLIINTLIAVLLDALALSRR